MTTVESGTAVGIEYIARGDARGRDPRGRARGRRPRLHEGRASRPGCRSACAAARSATTRRSRRRSASAAGAARRSASSSGRSARWRPSTSSTARTRPASAATCRARPRGGAGWSACAGMGPEPLDLNGRSRPTRSEDEAREHHEALRGDRDPDHEPDGGGGPIAHDPIGAVLSDGDKRGLARRSSARPTSRRTTSSSTTRASVEKIADEVVSNGKRCTATSWSGSSTTSKPRESRVDSRRKARGRGCEAATRPQVLVPVPLRDPLRRSRRHCSAAGVRAFVVLATRPAHSRSGAWSSWKPAAASWRATSDRATGFPSA